MDREHELALQKEFLRTHSCRSPRKRIKGEPIPIAPLKKEFREVVKTKKEVDGKYRKSLKRNRGRLIKNITVSEKVFKEKLDVLGIVYNFQEIFTISGSGYIVDFYLPEYKIVIEIDGNHHNGKRQKAKDGKRTNKLLRSKKINRIVRFNNKDALLYGVGDIRKALIQHKSGRHYGRFNVSGR